MARTRADHTKGRKGVTTAERQELARLRKENGELRTQRDVQKAAAFLFGGGDQPLDARRGIALIRTLYGDGARPQSSNRRRARLCAG